MKPDQFVRLLKKKLGSCRVLIECKGEEWTVYAQELSEPSTNIFMIADAESRVSPAMIGEICREVRKTREETA